MLRLRPYQSNDVETVLSWSKDERAFYKWTAGVLGDYPLTKEIYGAKKVSLGVFENNQPAYHCYKAVGFKDMILDTPEIYHVLGEEWKCLELEMQLSVY